MKIGPAIRAGLFDVTAGVIHLAPAPQLRHGGVATGVFRRGAGQSIHPPRLSLKDAQHTQSDQKWPEYLTVRVLG